MITDLLTIDMDKEPLKFEDWKFINSQRKIEVREVYKTILKTVVRILEKKLQYGFLSHDFLGIPYL